jgi:chromosomal replication initiator protein DnaA
MKRTVAPPPAGGREPSIWAPLIQTLQEEFSPRRARELLLATRLLDGGPSFLRLAIPRARIDTWLRNGTLLRLEALVHSLSGGGCALALIPVNSEPPPEIDPTQTLERFVTGPSNETCLEWIHALSSHPETVASAVLISGPTAVGKTHLLRGTATRLAQRNSKGPVLYRTAEDLSLEVANAIYSGKLVELRRELAVSGALIVDDLQMLAQRQATERELATLLRVLAERNAPVVLSADRPITELAELSEPLHRALRNADSIPLSRPEWETRAAIFLDRAQGWGVELGAKVAGSLASGVGDELDRVDAVLTRAMVLRRSEQETVSLENARRTLSSGPLYPRRPPPEAIIDVTARRFALRPRDLRARDRTAPHTAARQVAAYLLRTRCGLSFPEIGKKLERHYSTALHAVRQTELRLGQDASFANLLGLIEKEVNLRMEKGE